MGQQIRSINLVVQLIKAKLDFFLRFRMQRFLELLDFERRYQTNRQSPFRALCPTLVLDQGSFPPSALPHFIGTTTPSATPQGQVCASQHTRWPARTANHSAGFPVLRISPMYIHAIAITPVK